MKKRAAVSIVACAFALATAGCSSSTGSTSGGPVAGGSILFTASGEVLALGGYSFPPASMDDPAFVDGWEIKFTELLVTIDKITISENPDTDPGDQSKTGNPVAQVNGPFAVDLHKGGPLPGKGGSDEQAVQIATVDAQNLNGNKPFDADTRYAFGFDVVAPTDTATKINLDTQGLADYEIMKNNGYAILYVGTATFKGDSSSCMPADAEFDKLPKTINFKLGFKSPTTYVNCQNPDNDPAKPLGMEEHERGVVVKANQAVTAQVTIHTDHPFWESFVHDSPAHFDMIAAQYVGVSGTPTATLEDVKGIDPTAITAKDGKPLLWRTCTPFYTPPKQGQMSFDSQGIPIDPMGDPTKTIHDLYDFMTYNQSTQGHLNSDGLCFVQRHYPSPP